MINQQHFLWNLLSLRLGGIEHTATYSYLWQSDVKRPVSHCLFQSHYKNHSLSRWYFRWQRWSDVWRKWFWWGKFTKIDPVGIERASRTYCAEGLSEELFWVCIIRRNRKIYQNIKSYNLAQMDIWPSQQILQRKYRWVEDSLTTTLFLSCNLSQNMWIPIIHEY